MKIKKISFVLAACVALTAVMLTGCSNSDNNNAAVTASPKTTAKPTATPMATPDPNAPDVHIEIQMENGGKILAELYPKYAPQTVENFVTLAKSGFYDGLTFHRVIPSFMIQGGDPKGNGTGNADKTIPGEFAENGYKANTLKHTRGTLSMARSNAPNSASCQFFIVQETNSNNTASLDGKYAAFGMVTEGMEVVDEIAAAETDSADKPVTPVVIQSIRVLDE